MGRSAKIWPAWFSQALANAQARGDELAVFETESECAGVRLAFYKFLAEVRADESHALNEPAKSCTVQWLCAPNTRSKKVLRFVVAPVTSNPLADTATRAEIEHRLAIERALAEGRKELGK
jgi:hypothetical protein